MENSSNTLANQGQGLVNTAAEKMQGGIRDAGSKLSGAGAALSSKVDELRDDAVPMIREAGARAQKIGDKSADAVRNVAGRARDALSATSQSILNFTKDNPVEALLIAAASGALVLTLATAIKRARD